MFDIAVNKKLNPATVTALDGKFKQMVGANYLGMQSGVLTRAAFEDGTDSSAVKTDMDNASDMVIADSGLQVDVDLGTVLDDNVVFTNDPSEITTCLLSIYADDTTKDLELVGFQKTTGEYGAAPAGKSLVMDLKEYTIAVSGSTLTEITDYTGV